MKARLCGLALFLLLGFTAGKGYAQIITTTNSSAPTTNIEITATSSTALNIGWGGTSSTSYRVLYQTFTTTSLAFLLDKITLKISAAYSGISNASYTLSLYTFSSASSTTPTSTVSAWTGTLPTSTSMTDGTYLTFDMPDTNLSSNTVYGFSLAFNDYASNRSMNFYEGAGIYSGGAFFYANQDGTVTTTSNDLVFYLQSVPESSSLTLVFLALGCSAFLVRRRCNISPEATY